MISDTTSRWAPATTQWPFATDSTALAVPILAPRCDDGRTGLYVPADPERMTSNGTCGVLPGISEAVTCRGFELPEDQNYNERGPG